MDIILVYFLHRQAKLAVDVFVSGIVHYIGAFFLDLDRLDEEKKRSCRGAAVISAEDSAVCMRVILTDEELGIARRAYEM